MTAAYVIEVDDEGASTYHLVNAETYQVAKAFEGDDDQMMDWYSDNYDALQEAPTFHSMTPLYRYAKEKGLELEGELKVWLY